MIGYLKGFLVSKKPTQILLDVNGVGYIINITISTFEQLPDINSVFSIYTYLNVKEDALDLYGFINPAEKETFQLLISVNGIGPKLALSILSGIEVEELKASITDANLKRLIAIPGIGKKTGERLIIELRDKIKSDNTSSTEFKSKSGVKEDAVMALISLGYNQKQAEKIISSLLSESPEISIEELIKKSLGLLNK